VDFAKVLDIVRYGFLEKLDELRKLLHSTRS